MTAILIPIRQLVRRLAGDQAGNIMMIMGLAILPITFAIGFGVDYSRAEKLQTRLNAAADAAALVAIDPAMLCQSSATAASAATAMFQAQASAQSGIAGFVAGYNPQVTITPVSTSAGCTGTLRSATVTYRANAQNLFSAILGSPTLAIGGSATASAAQPPSMNFYIMLDISPSMMLPATSAGIAGLQGATLNVNSPLVGAGCAFACHTQNPQSFMLANDPSGKILYINTSASSATIPFFRISGTTVYDNNSNLLGTNASFTGTGATNSFTNPWGNHANFNMTYKPAGSTVTQTVAVQYADTWWVARNYSLVATGQSNIATRVDAETAAAKSVIQYAYAVEQQYATAITPPKYKMQFFTFDYRPPTALSTNGGSPSTTPYGVMTDVAATNAIAATSFPDLSLQEALLWDVDYWTTSSVASNDEDTDFPTMLTKSQTILPPLVGLGTAVSPLNVMMIITDGMMDIGGSGSCLQSGRVCSQLSSSQIATCTAIKNSGTRIAILYTEYLPAAITNSGAIFSGDAAISSNNVSQIQTALQACATKNPDGTYLMQTVTTDGDVSASLNALFQEVVQTARLVQ